jgi:hydrogenase nickel incorporation protein HypB
MDVPIVKSILSGNDQVAEANRAALDAANVLALNVMSSPGAGKTSLLLTTIERTQGDLRIGVVEGDLASSIDADTIAAKGVPAIQINTGGNCHLDAPMLSSALDYLSLPALDLLFVENVGNLICTANWALGTHLNVVIASTPESHDKPYKYPGMFAVADVVLLNKADLSEVFDFDLDVFKRGVEMVNAAVPVLPISCRSGAGLDAWMDWLLSKYHAR